MEIKRIPIAEILAATELVAEYAAECSLPEIGVIEPHHEMYAALETSGLLHCFGVFHHGEMVGFANVLTSLLPHYSRTVATVESLFVAKRHRTTIAGRLLMNSLEECAKEHGCTAILYSAPAHGKLEKLLARKRHYRHSNTVYLRPLNLS